MEIKESKHYIFNYNKNSIAKSDIDKIIDTQETCFEYICKFLDVNMDKKINYYLCETPDEVGVIYGDNEPCNACAKRPNNVYAVYNEDIKCIGFHEDAHIISYNTLGIPKQTFIREGLAMFFDRGYIGIPNYNWVNYFINNDLYINISSLIDNDNFYKYSHLITYTIAGAFVDYLICIYGVEKFKEFYSNLDNDFILNFNKIYNVDINYVEIKFISYIKAIKNSSDINKLIHENVIKLNVI